MSAEMAQKLVQGGIKAVRNGDHDLARKAFTQALKLDPNNEAAWLGMATITEGNDDKLRILKRVLEINPDNERAQGAIRRIIGEAPEPEPVVPEPEPEPAEEPMLASDLFADEDDEEPSADDTGAEASDEAYTTAEIEPITDVPPGDTGELSDFPTPDWALDEDVPGVDSQDAAEPEFVSRTSDEIFSQMPKIPTTSGGKVPTLPSTAVEATAEQVESEVQAYLEDALASYLDEDTEFIRKERGRAGSSEYRIFLLQAGAASFVVLALVMAGLITFVLNNPAAQRILFAPTLIPTSTPTNTPTATPGVTNTPSPTPRVPATSTPSLPSNAPIGFDDPNFPPTPTEVYYPSGVSAFSVPDEVVLLIEDGNLNEARQLIDQGVREEELTGEIAPIYRLSQWHLANNNPQQARQVLNNWEENANANNPDAAINGEALYLIGLARVDIYEARNNSPERFELLERAQERLESSLGFDNAPQIGVPDTINADAYILLAEVYQLLGQPDDALAVLDEGLSTSFNQTTLVNNTEIRMKRVEILVEEQRFDEAFQELYFVLEFDPFLEEALIQQTELALQTGQPGLGVLYAQQYLLYYPGSLQGLYLLGQAREAENKFDLALNAYSRAVAGDRTNREYTGDPFFLDNLLARATLLNQQGQRDEASEDFELAVQLAGNNPAIRARSLSSSFAAGEYATVINDAQSLIGTRGVNQGEVSYYQGLALVEQVQSGAAGAGNYSQASEALNRALNSGVLPGSLRPTALEYLALANLETRNYEDALNAISQALDSQFTADRLFIRAQIYDGQGNLEQALLDYEFLATWGTYFNFPFYDQVLQRYQTTVNRIGLR